MSKLTCWWRGYHLGPFKVSARNGEIYVDRLRCQDCGELAPDGRFRASTLVQWHYPNPLPPLENINSKPTGEQETGDSVAGARRSKEGTE